MVVLESHEIKRFVCISILTLFIPAISNCMIFHNNKIEKISIDNNVDECIEIMPDNLFYKNNLLFLHTKWENIKSTGYCGCKSALLSYTVVGEKKGADSKLYHDYFSSLNHNTFDFIVCRDFQKSYDSYKIYIQCKNPD